MLLRIPYTYIIKIYEIIIFIYWAKSVFELNNGILLSNLCDKTIKL